jgi:hypothetical protein
VTRVDVLLMSGGSGSDMGCVRDVLAQSDVCSVDIIMYQCVANQCINY